MMVVTRGSVDLLVILYSINVFITFSLSQLGHGAPLVAGARATETGWRHKLAINGFGFVPDVLDPGLAHDREVLRGRLGRRWPSPASSSPRRSRIKRHYKGVGRAAEAPGRHRRGGGDRVHRDARGAARRPSAKARTAVVLVNGFNGLGLHTSCNVPRMFGNTFRNFVFVQVGSVDAGNFKGAADIEALRAHTEAEAQPLRPLRRRRAATARRPSRPSATTSWAR